jgi:hypothetical protein
MTNPEIQVDDEIREMTDEEYAWYLENTRENETANPVV